MGAGQDGGTPAGSRDWDQVLKQYGLLERATIKSKGPCCAQVTTCNMEQSRERGYRSAFEPGPPEAFVKFVGFSKRVQLGIHIPICIKIFKRTNKPLSKVSCIFFMTNVPS